ncbi:unnamed protein product, partial [Brenthis ino]
MYSSSVWLVGWLGVRAGGAAALGAHRDLSRRRASDMVVVSESKGEGAGPARAAPSGAGAPTPLRNMLKRSQTVKEIVEIIKKYIVSIMEKLVFVNSLPDDITLFA